MLHIHVLSHDSRVKPWVARITGVNPRFGFARQFVRPRRDYRKAEKCFNGRTVGIHSCFMLEINWVCEFYEIRDQWKKTARYFARVSEDGLERMSEDRVIAWLQNNAS